MVCDEKIKLSQTSVILCPPSLSGWSVPVLLCPESSLLWEKPADVNAPIPPWTTGLQSLLKMRYEWRGGGGQHEMFFLLWDWSTGCEDGVFLFFLSPIFWLLSTPVIQFCHLVISPLYPVIISGGPSVAPDVTNTITAVPHPPTPSTPTFCFFDYLCFYRTLMAVFKTHCDV